MKCVAIEGLIYLIKKNLLEIYRLGNDHYDGLKIPLHRTGMKMYLVQWDVLARYGR